MPLNEMELVGNIFSSFSHFPSNFFGLSSIHEKAGPDTVLRQAAQSKGLLLSKAEII